MSVLSDLTFEIDTDSFLIVPLSLIEQLEKYRQLSSNDPEVGGTFSGIYRPPHIEITNFTAPQKTDLKSRFRFIRKSRKHIETVVKRWESSKGIETYLGEWHTHPEDKPTPSQLDIEEWQTKLPKGSMKFLLIVGRKTNWYGLWNGIDVINIL